MKKLWMSFAAFLMATTLVACSSTKEETPVQPEQTEKPTEETAQPEKQTLTIGVMGSIDAVPLVIAQEKGFFEEAGVEVKLEMFTAAKDRDAALMAGELDGVLADNVAISIYQNSDIDMKIIGMTDGYWTLVAGKDTDIKSIEDLKGKKIGISENTMIEYVVDDLITNAGLSVDDVEKVAIPAMPARLEMLRNNQIDAALLPAPFNDVAIADGGIEMLTVYNSDINISLLGMLQEVIETKPEAVQAYMKAYNKAKEYINTTDISEFEDIVISTVGYSEDMRGNIELQQLQLNSMPAAEKVNKVFEWSRAKGLLTKDMTAEDVIVEIK